MLKRLIKITNQANLSLGRVIFRNTAKPFITSILFLTLSLYAHISHATGKLVLIIDDVGYNKHDIDAINLEGPITYAVLPHTPFAQEYAQYATSLNKEVMLHIPMEALSGKALGPAALTSNMDQRQIEQVLTRALNEIPYAIGVNNHMGSLLTQKSSSMKWVMGFLKRHDLFFVDSKTTRFSLAKEQADKAGVINFHRNVFIDNDLSPQAMKKQFRQLIRIAQKYRRAIGIAHPYPETIAFLKRELPLLAQQGVKLTPISELITPYKLQLAKAGKSNNRGE